jgi:beta-fructofuranosidase
LDTNGKQLIQWPVEEIEFLRTNAVHLQDTEVKSGTILEVNVTDASLVTFLFSFFNAIIVLFLPFLETYCT